MQTPKNDYSLDGTFAIWFSSKCVRPGWAKKTPTRKANRYSSLPSGYSQVGTTQLYYKQNSNAIDMILPNSLQTACNAVTKGL